MSTNKRVFISYSHESDAHNDWVLRFSAALRKRGLESIIDRYVIPDIPLPQWMQQQIETSDYTLFVCTSRYKLRFEGKDQTSKGVTWEAMIANHVLYSDRTRNQRFIALIPDEGSEEHIPVPFRQYKYYRIPSQFETLVAHLAGQPEVVPPPISIPEPIAPAVSEDMSDSVVSATMAIQSDGMPPIDTMIEVEIPAPVQGCVCNFAVVSTRAGPEVATWDNQVFFDRPLLRNLRSIEPQQSFIAVVEGTSREPVCVTAKSKLFVHSTAKHGAKVEANAPIARVYIPRNNVTHPPFGTTRGQTYSSALKFTPILAASLWKLGPEMANRPPYILECDSIGQSGLSSVLASSAGLFYPAENLQVGLKVKPGTRLGLIRDGDDESEVIAQRVGSIAHVHVKEGAPVHTGRTLVSVRTSATELSLLISPIVSQTKSWFDLVAPVSGTAHVIASPGSTINPNTIICQIKGSNVAANLRIDIAEGQLMAIHRKEGDRVDFGDKVASILAVGLVIRSPMVGTFYRAASPGARAFASIGDRLSAGAPAYIIEAIKIMNEIEMPYDAVVAEIFLEDGQAVDWNQPVMRIIV